MDQCDHASIADELLRLLKNYRQSKSFVSYATGLLWTSFWFGLQHGGIPDALFDEAVRCTSAWTEETLGLYLACLSRSCEKLPVDAAYCVASQDVRSPRGVVTQRHSELHRDLFRKRFAAQFPEGLPFHASKQDRRLGYFAASATLRRLHDQGGPLATAKYPNVLGISSQFRPLVEIWAAAIEELKAYDRAHRKAGGDRLTAEMYEALPEELQSSDHPHFEAWYEVMERHVTDDGWTLVPIRELATLENVPERKRLTKAQSVQLATTAMHMGLGMEPDPRITGQPYEWDELVSMFPVSEELSDGVASYHAAAVLLELGIAIAAADGQVDEIELKRLSSHIESQLDLSSQDSARLEHLRYLLVRQPPIEFSGAKTLQKNLTVKERKIVGEFLVGIAAADEVISPQEIKAIARAYRALGLVRLS